MNEGPLTARGRWLRMLNYALVCAVVGVLLWLFLRRVGDLQHDAEQFAFERTHTALRHAVHLRAMRALAEGGPAVLIPLIGGNALLWTDWQTASGETAAPAADGGQAWPSGWSYSTDTGRICFTPALSSELRCFRVAAQFDDANSNGRLDWPQETPIGLRLEPIELSAL